MDDNNKLPKQAKPQEFELVELLFQEHIISNIASPNIEYSFKARFQSFIDQVPSYLHSSNKPGFFTHFFFGSFATLLDTELSKKIGINKLHYNFDRANILRIVAETDDKTHVLIFSESGSKNNQQQRQDKNKDLEFTTGEWQKLKGREYTDADKDNLEISVIKVNKSKGRKVTVEKQDIKDAVANTKQYHEVTKQCVDDNTEQYVYLEDEVSKFSSSKADKQADTLKFILKYIKKIHDHYQGLPYGDGAREADQHGFVAGIFNNFRYRENAHVYLEQFAGKGYADMVFLVRGAERSTKSIPIIIELKAGSGSGTTSSEALAQVTEYSKGFQPNNMRILSLSDNILCVGMNLDHDANSFMQMKLVQRQIKVIPVMQSITRTMENDLANQNLNEIIAIQNQIKDLLENSYNTFPGVGEKSSSHYFSRFMVGESLALQDYDKHIFIYDADEYIATKIIIDAHVTRSRGGSTVKQQKIEKVVDSSNAVTSILFLPIRNSTDPAIIVNIIDANREVILKNIPLDNAPIDNRKIVELNIKFNIHKSNKSFEEYCDIELLQVYNSTLEYNKVKGSEKVNGNFKVVDAEVSDNLIDNIRDTIDSQRDLIISESKYKELFKKLGEVIYPLKSLVNNESEFQGILEGIFKYYSDITLNEQLDRRELVLTEFQTGSGGRIDMLIQAIGTSEQGTKEYMPVGLELKYDNSVKLNAFDKEQDENIQGLMLRHKEQVLVNKLLSGQTERYAQGAAIKSITDGNKVAIMGLVFNAKAKDAGDLLLTTDKFLEAEIVHSSKLYTISRDVKAPDVNGLPLPDSEYFEPGWVHRETYDRLAEMQEENRDLLSLFNKHIDDNAIKQLQISLMNNLNLRSMDGIDLSFNAFTATGLKGLVNMLRTKLIYLDLSDNDLARDNFADLEEIIENIELPILKIADIGMNNHQMKRIIELLAGRDRVSHLEIQHLESVFMTSDVAHSIASYFKSTKHLDYLDVSKSGINNEAIKIIAQGLKGQKTLKKLILSENKMGISGAEFLSKLLPKSVVSDLDLSGNPLGIKGFSHIVMGLNHHSSKVEVIKLVNVGVKYDKDKIEDAKHLTNIIQILFQNSKLTNIDISYNNIGTGLLSQIFDILSKTDDQHSLQHLGLAGNVIDWGVHAATINTLKARICMFLKNNRAIRSLDLSYMEIDDELGQEIAVALETNGSLISLDLSGNTKISTNTIVSLAKTLSIHQYLKYLNLSDNKLNVKDIKTLLAGLKSNQDLSYLNLSDNDFSGIITNSHGQQSTDLDNQYVDFKNLLKDNTVLKYLNLAKCKLNTQSLQSLFAVLKENSSLEILDIRGNTVDSEIIDYVLEALRHNANQGLNRLKVVHISKDGLDHDSIIKLTDKSLGISILVDDYIPQDGDLSEEINQTCTTGPSGVKNLARDDQHDRTTFEYATNNGNYLYWLQQHDIPDIARVHYGYREGELEVVGSVEQLSNVIADYRVRGSITPFTVILNHGGNHWVSLVFNRVNNQYHAYYVDSLGDSISGGVVSVLNNNRMLIHDIGIMQQNDGHNCGLWALENGHRISQVLLENSNIAIESIRNSVISSYSNQELQALRRSIASELENDVLRQGRLVEFGLIPAPAVIANDQGSWEVSLDCLALPVYYIMSKHQHKRSISNESSLKILLNKEFLNCIDHNTPKYKIGYELIKLVNLEKLIVDNASCSIFSNLKYAFYSQLYSKMYNVNIEMLCNKIREALLSNDISKLRRVLDKDIKDLNVLEIISRETFLIYAVERLDIEWTRLLIEKGANINARDTKGNTALYYAIKKQEYEVVKLLIEHRANLNVHSNDNDMALHISIKNNNTEVSKLLIKAGVDVNVKGKEGNTPLILATIVKNKELANDLMARGADVNIQNDNGNTATLIIVGGATVVGVAVAGGTKIASGVIGAAGAIVSAAGSTMVSVGRSITGIPDGVESVINKARGYSRIDSSSDREILESLMEHGADLNAVDSFGNTPLHNAVANRDVEMVEFCVNNGANINTSNKLDESPLHMAINNLRYRGIRTTRDIKQNITDSNDDSKTKEIIYILVEHNASLNIQNNNGDTALHLAIEKGDKEVIELLLRLVKGGSILLCIENNNGNTIIKLALMSGNDDIISCFINFRDDIGSSILHLAVKNNAKEIIDLLIKHKVDLNMVDNYGSTAIHLAVSSNNEDLVEYLIGCKVNINIQDMYGNTPMHLSAQVGNIKIFEMFLDDNANLNLKNQNDKTPIDLAKESGMNFAQFELPIPVPYKTHNAEGVTTRSEELENIHHKHRHHHGEEHASTKYHIDKRSAYERLSGWSSKAASSVSGFPPAVAADNAYTAGSYKVLWSASTPEENQIPYLQRAEQAEASNTKQPESKIFSDKQIESENINSAVTIFEPYKIVIGVACGEVVRNTDGSTDQRCTYRGITVKESKSAGCYQNLSTEEINCSTLNIFSKICNISAKLDNEKAATCNPNLEYSNVAKPMAFKNESELKSFLSTYGNSADLLTSLNNNTNFVLQLHNIYDTTANTVGGFQDKPAAKFVTVIGASGLAIGVASFIPSSMESIGPIALIPSAKNYSKLIKEYLPMEDGVYKNIISFAGAGAVITATAYNPYLQLGMTLYAIGNKVKGYLPKDSAATSKVVVITAATTVLATQSGLSEVTKSMPTIKDGISNLQIISSIWSVGEFIHDNLPDFLPFELPILGCYFHPGHP